MNIDIGFTSLISVGYYAITTDLLCFDHLALHGLHWLSAAQQLQAPAT